jgi:hypothetical protein
MVAGDMIKFWMYHSFINVMKRYLLYHIKIKILFNHIINKYDHNFVFYLDPIKHFYLSLFIFAELLEIYIHN